MSGTERIEAVWLTQDDEGNAGVWLSPDNARQWTVQDRDAEVAGVYEWVNDPDRTHELLLRDDEPTGLTLRMMLVADADVAERAKPADVVTVEQQQDGAAERVEAFLDLRERYESTPGMRMDTRNGSVAVLWDSERNDLTIADLRAVLAERTALAARVAELEGEREADTRVVEALLDAQADGASMAECKHAFKELRARFADRIAALEPTRDVVRRFTDAVAKRDKRQPDPPPTDGWILWDSEGRWMHTTTFTTTTDANRRDDGWRAVSINEDEAGEFRSKGCILDRLDSTGWSAFAQLRGTLRAGGSRDQWLAKCAEPCPLTATETEES